MKTSLKLAAAFVALAGIAGAGLAAQAESRRDGVQTKVQQTQRMHHHGKQWSGHHGRHHGPRHRHHMFRLLDSFDANGDGKLSQEEIDQARAERLGRFDSDADQALTLQEYEQLWLDAMRERMVDGFQHLDADGDGKVTVEEFQRPFANTVRHMDRNEDGVIDRNDFRHRYQGERRGRGSGDNG